MRALKRRLANHVWLLMIADERRPRRQLDHDENAA
jgi:hypothetical protein